MDLANMGHGTGSAGNMSGMQHGNGQQMNEQMWDCIQNCLNCHSICLRTVAYCLQKGGQHAEARHITSLLDGAETCQASANFMLRGSELHGRVCEVCAEACTRCAESCEQMGNDPQMEACAQECRRCAESCRDMASVR